MWRFWFQLAGVVEIDKNRFAARRHTSRNIAGAITNHKTLRQVYLAFTSSVEQHAWLRLSARTFVSLRVSAQFDPIDRQIPKNLIVHVFDGGSRDEAFSNVRLVGDYDQHITRLFQTLQSSLCFRIQLKIFEAARRETSAIPHLRYHENAVPIQEYGATTGLARRGHHFVRLICSFG